MQIDLSALSFGAYEFYASTGQYCLLGSYNGNWSIIAKAHADTMLTNENTLQFTSGTWYSYVYRRKIL